MGRHKELFKLYFREVLLGLVLDQLLFPLAWRTENQQRSYLVHDLLPQSYKTLCLGTCMAYRSENSFIKTFLVIIFQLSVSHQLLPKGGWAGKPKGAGSWARCRSQEPPSQAAAPAAVWFGAFRALETQSSFSRLVCAHTCRPAFNVESHHSTKQWRTQEKPSLKEKVLSE